MNPYITGEVVRQLREKEKLTQSQLAEKLNISDKTVSRWETGKGYPDITLLEPLANALRVSVTELISGEIMQNTNIAGNMLRAHFYVCPICGNVMIGSGKAAISCHGITLIPANAEPADGQHEITVENIDDELYASVRHPMTKNHYISFIAAVSVDRIQLVKLYPEGTAAARLMKNQVEKIVYYCNRDGLFQIKL